MPHDTLQDIARSDAFDRISRFGWAVKGFVFGSVGVLALLHSLGESDQPTDPRGLLGDIGDGGVGSALLALIGVGLVAYGGWRIAASVLDAEGHGSDWKALIRRSVFFFVGLVYLTLAFTIGEALMTSGDGPDGESDYSMWTLRALELPAGQVLVALAGAGTIAAAVVQAVAAYRASFLDFWEHPNLTERKRRWFGAIGRVGYVARGVVFAMIGFYLVRAGLNDDAGEAQNVGDTLRELGSEPILLTVVGAGFIAFGVHCLLDARYRHISVDRGDRYDDGHE